MYLRILAAMLASAAMAGCNTIPGTGKDVQSIDASPENSVEKHGLPCEPRRLQPALLDFPKGSRQRACV